MQRHRVTFEKGEPVRYVSHLDLMRTWERTLRRAGLHPAHTQGFNPRPRLVFAAPLPVGVTSTAELVDVIVEDELDAAEFRARVEPALPPGLVVTNVVEVALDTPPLMATIVSSDYVADLGEPITAAALKAFLDCEHVAYQRSRKAGTKQADMRPAVLDLWLADGGRKLGMRLRLDVEGLAVRPDEVLQALGLEARRVQRTALALKERVHAAA
ncbi:MAG: DUF2344 domain-containing protein [Chloroflexi bacterium]|nr:DUF2344 domain-containing protein [Chloroflexota bacterium]